MEKLYKSKTFPTRHHQTFFLIFSFFCARSTSFYEANPIAICNVHCNKNRAWYGKYAIIKGKKSEYFPQCFFMKCYQRKKVPYAHEWKRGPLPFSRVFFFQIKKVIKSTGRGSGNGSFKESLGQCCSKFYVAYILMKVSNMRLYRKLTGAGREDFKANPPLKEIGKFF